MNKKHKSHYFDVFQLRCIKREGAVIVMQRSASMTHRRWGPEESGATEVILSRVEDEYSHIFKQRD